MATEIISQIIQQRNAATTEGGRFESPIAGNDLTIECARRFKADLEVPANRKKVGGRPGKGPDSLQEAIERGMLHGVPMRNPDGSVVRDEYGDIVYERYVPLEGESSRHIVSY
ncbi:MAG: hypothetical protein Q7S76_00800 [bacterium]|nr:hypothetical protein [bacterium]